MLSTLITNLYTTNTSLNLHCYTALNSIRCDFHSVNSNYNFYTPMWLLWYLRGEGRWMAKDQLLNWGGGKKSSFYPFWWEKRIQFQEEKSSICWVKTEKCDTKLQYVIQAKVNLLGPLYWISVGISFSFFFYHFLFFFSFLFFSLFEWQLLLFFRNDQEANGTQINVASVTTPFSAQPSLRSNAQSSEWINIKLALIKNDFKKKKREESTKLRKFLENLVDS